MEIEGLDIDAIDARNAPLIAWCEEILPVLRAIVETEESLASR